MRPLHGLVLGALLGCVLPVVLGLSQLTPSVPAGLAVIVAAVVGGGGVSGRIKVK